MTQESIRCAIVGYGPVFNWGWMHARWMGAVPEMAVVALCDRDPQRAAQAARDFPQVETFTDLGQMLAREDIDLVSVVTPHNTHAAIALECLRAGRHVCVEKPFSITVAEATEMIDTAREMDRMLAVFHNRRHDGNVRAIREIVQGGGIGEVFHIEVAAMGWQSRGAATGPDEPWRNRKDVSGGNLYDWGAHAIDWVLSLVPARMKQVTGFFHRFGGDAAANEDQTRALILFENGCVAEIIQSRRAALGRPYLWCILGSRGAILDTGQGAIEGYCRELTGPPGGSFTLRTESGERRVPYLESDWVTYYFDLADHLLRGAPVPVSGEDGRRVIAVLETAERSAECGRSLEVPYP